MRTVPMAQPATVWSKLTLTGMAIAGTLTYHFVLIAPFAFLMLFNPWVHYYGTWLAVGVLIFIWWTLQPNHVTPGVPISRSDAPALFDAVEALAHQLDAPDIDEIRTVSEFNAAAVEEPVRWQPWRKRRVLILGVPLLALTDKSTVQGVIAHELGHFSHKHGRLGQWLYRARVGWLEYAAATSASVSLLERGVAHFAGWFAPRFSRLSYGYSRQCEFEADAFGAGVVGKLQMASALLTIETFSDRWAKMSQEQLPRLIASQETPPSSWMAEVQRQVLKLPPQPEEWKRLQVREPNEHDTHPSIRERVKALGISDEELLRAATLPDQSAGSQWIRNWSSVIAHHDAEWQSLHADSWRHEHIRQRHQRIHLDSLRAAEDPSIERARLELEYGEPGTVIRLSRRWLEEPSQAAHASFLLGAAQLASGDKTGFTTLEGCISRDSAWAAAARSCIERHASMLESEAQRRRNHALLRRALKRCAIVLGLFHNAVSRGALAPARIDNLAWTVLHEMLSGTDVIAAAWCAGEELTHDGRSYTIVALILRLHTDRLSEARLTEDDVCSRALDLLNNLLPAATLKLVWSAYTTEPLSPELDSCLAAWAQSNNKGCLVIPKPGDSVGPGVRASALG
jgi:Zn-dependent protease with chaperone function